MMAVPGSLCVATNPPFVPAITFLRNAFALSCDGCCYNDTRKKHVTTGEVRNERYHANKYEMKNKDDNQDKHQCKDNDNKKKSEQRDNKYGVKTAKRFGFDTVNKHVLPLEKADLVNQGIPLQFIPWHACQDVVSLQQDTDLTATVS